MSSYPVSWRRPRREWLRPGGLYPLGMPPFDPFPTVSDVIAADFCPYACVHRLLHGVQGSPTITGETGLERAGDLFHQFIALVKSLIVSGRLRRLTPGTLRREFEEFMGHLGTRYPHGVDSQRLWDNYVRPWCERKLDELNEIEVGARLFFEVDTSSAYVRFEHGDRSFSYPLKGRIDELNLDEEVIVERTIVGTPYDESPPDPDAMQIWLLWKTLTSIDRENYPSELRDVDFRSFELIVETPYRDFEVRHDNPEFEERALRAYSWIRDIAEDPRGILVAHRERRCDREPGIRCSFMYRYIGCRRRLPNYPLVRPAMRQRFRGWYRSLLWELMWDRDFFEYALLMLRAEELERDGLIIRARLRGELTDTPEGTLIELELPSDAVGPVAAHVRDIGRCTIVFGTFHLGQRLEGELLDTSGEGRIRIIVRRRYMPIMLSSVTILSDTTLLESRPWFLIRRIQRYLFQYEQIGRDRNDRAREDAFVQLVEALFGGPRSLARGGENRE
ncbi:MAG: hypothetical protein DRP01_07765 [Archaeoglobales archaeon]|nr:MAG: hypothetical protein DRP01_07765 [Archaeoglobales archaeon]